MENKTWSASLAAILRREERRKLKTFLTLKKLDRALNAIKIVKFTLTSVELH